VKFTDNVSVSASGTSDGQHVADNPLLQHWSAPYGLPPFSSLQAEHFEPALRHAMQVQRQELAAISSNPAAPNFDNTLVAFDRTGRLLDAVAAVFYSLAASATNPALQAVQRAMAGPMAAHHSAVYMDAALFARIDAVYATRSSPNSNGPLSAEALRLLERVHLDFVRAGARLAPAARARYAQVMEKLAELNTRFAQNLLHDESTWALPLPDEHALAGLPPYLRAATQQAAADRGLTGHVLTLARSLVVPFLSTSERPDLREQAWRAWVGRGEHAGEHDNRPVAREILRLRKEQAALHGHACFADFALADTMAGKRAAVQGLLGEVWPRALAAVQRERQELAQQMRAEGLASSTIEPWDWRYWAEKVRRNTYAVDDAEVKPYFQLEKVAQAAFDCAGRLFGLSFTARSDLPVYHPDVKAYEVRDKSGTVVGIFMQDNFARPAKRSGAWMNNLRSQTRNLAAGQGMQVPVVQNNNNFAKGAPGEPTLLSLDDARTLFHEFGHGLHGLLSNVTYERLSGTQVLRDFVELPSQIFEHWITEPEVLQRHARHWQTGEPIPLELIQRMQRARRFGQGYETVRYTASAMVDMAVHSLADAEPPADLCAFEAQLLQEQGLPHGVGINHRLVHFQHLFASAGYAAGYYVYLWAEVLDADGYDAFTEAGSPFDPAVAARLKQHIYSSGNSLAPGAAYVAFRGREATVMPLLKKRGLLPEAEPA
jgi:peptidyl-dipeptidase Dcp